MSKFVITIDDEDYQVQVTPLEVSPAGEAAGTVFSPSPAMLDVQVNGQTARVTIPQPRAPGDEIDWVIVDGRPYEIGVDHPQNWVAAASVGRSAPTVSPHPPDRFQHSPAVQHAIQARSSEVFITRPLSRDGQVSAPIPGRVIHVLVSPGQPVEAGQPLVILEAMKMENEIRAPCPGLVQAIHVQPGQCVKRGEKLIEVG